MAFLDYNKARELVQKSITDGAFSSSQEALTSLTEGGHTVEGWNDTAPNAMKNKVKYNPFRPSGIFTGSGTRLSEGMGEQVQQIHAGSQRTLSGEQTVPEQALQTVGNIGDIAGEVIGEGATAAAKLFDEIAPQQSADIQNEVQRYIELAKNPELREEGGALDDVLATFVTSPTGQGALRAAERGAESYIAWSEENPRAAANWEAIASIGLWMFGFKGIKPAAKAIKGGSKAIAGGEAGQAVRQIATEAGEGLAQEAKFVAGGIKKAGTKAGERAVKAGEFITSPRVTTEELRTTLASRVSGVDRELLKKAKTNPRDIEKALSTVKDAPIGSFHNLADRTAKAVQGIRETAAKAFTEAKKPFVEAGETFDLSQKLSDVATKLNETSSLIKINQLRNKAGKFISTFKVEAPVGVLKSREQKIIQSMVDRIRAATNLTPDEVINLRAELGAFTESLPTVQGKTSQATRIANRLTGSTLDAMEKILPKELSGAYAIYRRYYDIYDKLGKKLLNKKGNLKTTAEGVIAGSGTENKQQMRNLLEEIGEELGININDEVGNIIAIKEALGQKIPGELPLSSISKHGAINEFITTIREMVVGKEATIKKFIEAGKKPKTPPIPKAKAPSGGAKTTAKAAELDPTKFKTAEEFAVNNPAYKEAFLGRGDEDLATFKEYGKESIQLTIDEVKELPNKIRVYRGIPRDADINKIDVDPRINIENQSWTTERSVAKKFGEQVIEKTVNKSDIDIEATISRRIIHQVLNEAEIVIKTKPQLTDIFNKAKGL